MYYATGQGMMVLQALVLTAAIFLSLTAYVLVTKKDFSFMGARPRRPACLCPVDEPGRRLPHLPMPSRHDGSQPCRRSSAPSPTPAAAPMCQGPACSPD
jgi:hypothetical protein